MNRQEILNIINEIIEEEHGEPVEELDMISDCAIDSFGYAMLFVGLDGQIEQKTGIKVFDNELLKTINPNTIRVCELIDMIEGKLCI